MFKTRWLNAAFLRLYGVLTWWNFHEYAMSHTYHHTYTLHPRADKEVVLPKPPSLAPLYLLQLFTFNVTGGFESRGARNIIGGIIKTAFGRYTVLSTPGWLEALYANQPAARRRAVTWARVVLLIHVAVAAVSFAYGLWIVPVLFSLAPAIANWWRYFVAVPMHCGLRDNVPDFRKCVRTNTLDPLSEFLYWRMNWHLEHHMFAGIPCYRLKALHRAVAHDMPTPQTLVWRATAPMRETMATTDRKIQAISSTRRCPRRPMVRQTAPGTRSGLNRRLWYIRERSNSVCYRGPGALSTGFRRICEPLGVGQPVE